MPLCGQGSPAVLWGRPPVNRSSKGNAVPSPLLLHPGGPASHFLLSETPQLSQRQRSWGDFNAGKVLEVLSDPGLHGVTSPQQFCGNPHPPSTPTPPHPATTLSGSPAPTGTAAHRAPSPAGTSEVCSGTAPMPAQDRYPCRGQVKQQATQAPVLSAAGLSRCSQAPARDPHAHWPLPARPSSAAPGQ